jgi:hypothetical protein
MKNGALGNIIKTPVSRAHHFIFRVFASLYFIIHTPVTNFFPLMDDPMANFPCGIAARPFDHGRIHIENLIVRGTDIDGVVHGFHHQTVFFFLFPKGFQNALAFPQTSIHGTVQEKIKPRQ